ncbi:MAG: Hsp20/alpha crystallin family protein [Bacteroidetes bacterium]|nr:Hsp20/alpha crystallin family protein [Bacteroidota bacterium]
MSLVKWNSDSDVFPSFSRWMDDFFDPRDNWFMPMKGANLPAVNVKELKDAFKLELAVPGFKKEDFNLEINQGYLTISGETKVEKEDKDEKITRQEYRFSSFTRTFTLPENVHSDQIAAEYADGILKITLPKKVNEVKPAKQISVK